MVTEVASTPKFLAFHQFEFHIDCWIFNSCACLYHFVLVHFYLIQGDFFDWFSPKSSMAKSLLKKKGKFELKTL